MFLRNEKLKTGYQALFYALLCLALLSSQAAIGQSWEKLDTEPFPGKQDDIVFIDENKGWYVNGAGNIFHTEDGGQSWKKQLAQPGTFFRTIAFIDEKRGFAGTVGTDYFPGVSDTIPVYKTLDGGQTWRPVQYKGPYVKGLCAIDIVREQYVNHGKLDERIHLYAVGRVGSPANILVSHDAGATWESRSMQQDCKMLFDIKMLDKNTGFACAATNADVSQSNALILKTTDGGKSWKKVYQSKRPFELTWKISFPSPEIGYVTLQSYHPNASVSQQRIVKTTDGGESWEELKLVDNHKARPFGIGFITAEQGYVGTMTSGFETQDGGKSWTPVNLGRACNKIRFYENAKGETYGYAIGVEVFKYKATASPAPKFEGTLKRQSYLGLSMQFGPSATTLRAVPSSHPLFGKLEEGDTLLAINGQPARIYPEIKAALASHHEGDSFNLLVRNKVERRVKGVFGAKPLETSQYGAVIYDQAAYKNGQLRVIINKPAAPQEKYPAMLFVPGYACTSIDNLPTIHPYKRIIDEYHKAGFVTLRIEKSGLGDSYNTPACVDCDLLDEVENFKVGLKKLKSLPYVDTSQIIIVGHSMGGVIAPALAAEDKVAGVVVYGTSAKSWFEYQIEMYRVQNRLAGMDPLTHEKSVQDQYEIIYRFFIEKEPLSIIAQDSANRATLEQFWMYDGSNKLMGRNAEYWRQIQDVNHIKNWKNTEAAVLVQFGESDFQAFSRSDHEQIVETVNYYRPGTATLRTFPGTDHYYAKVGSMQAAYDKFASGQYQQLFELYNPEVGRSAVAWSLELLGLELEE